jgi:hypothetical protein
MADLSPAAQAVLDAFLDTPGSEPMTGWDYKRDIAAALRAAAQFNPGPFVPELFGDGWKAAMGELEYIAAELDNNQPTREGGFDA